MVCPRRENLIRLILCQVVLLSGSTMPCPSFIQSVHGACLHNPLTIARLPHHKPDVRSAPRFAIAPRNAVYGVPGPAGNRSDASRGRVPSTRHPGGQPPYSQSTPPPPRPPRSCGPERRRWRPAPAAPTPGPGARTAASRVAAPGGPPRGTGGLARRGSSPTPRGWPLTSSGSFLDIEPVVYGLFSCGNGGKGVRLGAKQLPGLVTLRDLIIRARARLHIRLDHPGAISSPFLSRPFRPRISELSQCLPDVFQDSPATSGLIH